MTEPKPIEQMTPEEIAAERREIALRRAELSREAGAPMTDDVLLGVVRHTGNPEADAAAADAAIVAAMSGAGTDLPEDAAPAPWPHSRGEFRGIDLEYRKPSQGALVALALVSSPTLTPTDQVMLIRSFLSKHLSSASYAQVLVQMTDPDDELGINELLAFFNSVD